LEITTTKSVVLIAKNTHKKNREILEGLRISWLTTVAEEREDVQTSCWF